MSYKPNQRPVRPAQPSVVCCYETSRHGHGWPAWIALGLALYAGPLSADDRGIVITAQEKWSNVFGGSEAKLHLSVTSRTRLDGVMRWNYSANGRTVAGGESLMDVPADGTANVVVPLRFPAVKDGVIFATQLDVSIAARDGQQAAASLRKPIWVFPRDAFFDRSRWLKELKITLFDPPGDTAEVFADAAIPFTQTRNVAALSELSSGLLVIGEGVSLAKNRSLAESLYGVAARGLPVLCLAPGDGRFPMLEGDAQQAIWQRMDFRRNDVITQLDKRLDARQWLPGREPVTSRLVHASYRNRLVLEVSHTTQGWPWWETRSRERGVQQCGVLAVCGFGLIQHWHHGPTPRFLLARLFEHVTEDLNNSPSDQNDGE
ncbi:MAG: hypothetical protein QGG71_19685 [Pirellulaceae bacterium]|jgi:hypothetical protein|nr:hypothetical protein [Pirellulaceae bacterium]